MKELSRRGFLTAAAVTAAGAAVAGMAGCSPKDTGDQKKEEAVQTRWSWETKPEPIADGDIAETIDTEICIIGLGSSGTTAALAAAQSGAKVTVLQKMEKVQTNGWCVAAYNSKKFLEAGQTYDLPQIYADFANLSNGRDNPRAVNLFLRRSGEVMDYIIRQTPEHTPVMLESGHTYGWFINNDMATRYEQFRLLLNTMVEKAVAAGANIMYETPAVRLVQDERSRDGSRGPAQRQVVRENQRLQGVCATGDLSDDPEMPECFAPMLQGVQTMHGAPCNTGDGHKMGLWAGAAMDEGPHCIMMHFDPTWMPEGGAPYSGIPWLRVNLKGERFANEDLGYQSVVTSVRLQPEQTAFQITDANWAVHAAKGDYKHPNSHSRATTNPEADWQDAIERGAIRRPTRLKSLRTLAGSRRLHSSRSLPGTTNLQKRALTKTSA